MSDLLNARLKPSEVECVALTLGGSCYVSRAALAAGSHSLRCYTKTGKPRYRRGSVIPLMTGPALLIGVPIPTAPGARA